MSVRWRRTIALAVVLGTAGIAYAVYALRVTEVRVVGTQTLSPNEIVTAAGLRGDERILWMQMSRTAREVERVPGVANARADRSLPGTVVIEVTERMPLARLDGRPALVSDVEGVLFPYDRERALPTLAGWKARARAGARLDAASRAVLEAVATLPRELRGRLRRVETGPPVTATLDDATEIRFGEPTDLEAKARAATAVLTDAAARGMELAYVDVRAPNAPASRRREAPAPSPTPEAAARPR